MRERLSHLSGWELVDADIRGRVVLDARSVRVGQVQDLLIDLQRGEVVAALLDSGAEYPLHDLRVVGDTIMLCRAVAEPLDATSDSSQAVAESPGPTAQSGSAPEPGPAPLETIPVVSTGQVQAGQSRIPSTSEAEQSAAMLELVRLVAQLQAEVVRKAESSAMWQTRAEVLGLQLQQAQERILALEAPRAGSTAFRTRPSDQAASAARRGLLRLLAGLRPWWTSWRG